MKKDNILHYGLNKTEHNICPKLFSLFNWSKNKNKLKVLIYTIIQIMPTLTERSLRKSY
jgi:hypothetical protein